jgi:hypothetical protein
VPRLTPVDYDPFSQPARKLTPVDFDPFGQSNADLPTIAGPLGFSDEFRQATGAGNLSAIGPTLADLFGNYEDVAASLQKIAPGAKVVKDRDGLETLELPDGRRFRMNNKGVDANEVAAGVARVGSFIPAARAVNAVGGAARAIPGLSKFLPAAGGTSARVAAGGVTGVGGDLAQQVAAGRTAEDGRGIDEGQAALSGLFGAAGEFVAPVAGAIRNAFTPKAAEAEVLAIGRSLGLETLTDAQRKILAALAPQIKEGMPKEAVLAQLVTGAPIMRGQLPGRFDDASILERLKNTAGEDPAGQQVRAVLDSQFAGLNRARDDLLNNMSGGQGPVTAADAVTRARDALAQRASGLETGIEQAYGQLAGKSASISGDYAATLPTFVGQRLKDASVPESSILAQASTFAKSQVDKFIRNPEGKTLETLRREMNEIYKTAANDADRRGVTIIKKSLDEWVGEALTRGVIDGDTAVIEGLKKARDLRAQFGRMFEAKDAADKGGKWIEAALEGKSVDELTQAVFGAGQVSPKASVQIAQRLKTTLGEDKAAWDSFRSAYLTRLTSGKDGKMLGYQAIQANIRQFLREQPDLAKTILSGPEKTALNNLANAAEFLMPKGDMARSSGSVERAMRMISSAMNNAPLIGNFMQMIAKPRDLSAAYRQTSLPYRPLPAGSPAPAALGGPTQTYLQNNTQRPRPIR